MNNNVDFDSYAVEEVANYSGFFKKPEVKKQLRKIRKDNHSANQSKRAASRR